MPATYPDQDLDMTLLNEIADGSDEFIIEAIDMFLKQTPELLQLITDSMAQKDWENAGAYAHKLKPTLGFFGMLNTQELLQQIESACTGDGGNLNDVISQFDQAKTNLTANATTLTKLRNEIAANL